MQKIIPNLWLDTQAEEAANFYVNVFGGKIGATSRYTEAGQEVHGQQPGSVMTTEVEIDGLNITLLNGGPAFKINPSISVFITKDTKEEIDAMWAKLSDGGKALMPLQKYDFSEYYGWVQDKFGMSWQVTISSEGSGKEAFPALLFTQDQAGKAEEAMNFYASVFPDSKVGLIARYPAGMGPEKEGTVMYGEMSLFGQKLTAMDSAQTHEFKFNEGLSLLVECEDQAEIDKYWERLSVAPESEQCGWLKDKYGVSWQITPRSLDEMLRNGTPEQVKAVTEAFMQMKKLDAEKLQSIYDNTK